jgi:membrane protease subunit HflC
MMKGIAGVLAVLIAIGVFVAYTAVFFVQQTEQALVLRFGEPIRVVTAPGIQYKVPFVDTVIYIDKRILDLDNPAQEVIASDQKRLVVDAFARYRITDPLRFYQSIGTIPAANSQLATILNSALRRVLGESTFIQVVRDERSNLMGRIRDQLNREAQNYGIDVVDVKIRRADLPEANSQAIFQRMQTERQREAAEIRAQGAEQAQRTRARSDRDVTVLLAEANSKSEQVRGEGDGERNRIFAEAYGRDADFFGFYRSMQAYENGLKGGDTRLLIAPDSDFFRYFNSSSGQAPGAAAPGAAAATPTR